MEAIKQEGIAGLESLRAEIGTAPVTGPDQAAANTPSIDTKDQLSMLMGPMFGVLFPAWNLQPEEIDGLAEAYAKVADKWFPGGLNLGVELEALMITAMIFGPRLKMPRKAPKKQPDSSEGGKKDA